jgi:hypothetical protein
MNGFCSKINPVDIFIAGLDPSIAPEKFLSSVLRYCILGHTQRNDTHIPIGICSAPGRYGDAGRPDWRHTCGSYLNVGAAGRQLAD